MKLSTLIFNLIWLSASSFFFTEICEAKPDFQYYHDARYGFELKYPDSLIRLEASSNEIPLALRTKEGFPSFNILIQAGQRNTVPGLNFCEHIVADYRKIGLTDAKITDIIELQSGVINKVCGISYTHKLGSMTSWAAIVNQENSFFLLTLVGTEQTLANEYRFIFSSFTLESATSATQPEEATNELLWVALGALWLLIILGYLVLRRKKQS